MKELRTIHGAVLELTSHGDKNTSTGTGFTITKKMYSDARKAEGATEKEIDREWERAIRKAQKNHLR